MSAGDEGGRFNVTVAKLTLTGGIIAVLGAIIVALINTSSAAQSNPTPTPTPTSSSTSPTTTSTPPEHDEDRRHFQVPVGEFTLYGDMVWRGESSVASSGGLELGDAEDSAKCRVRIEFTPTGINAMPVGKKEVRGCVKEKFEKAWPEFGPVEFQNDRKIAYVTATVYLDDKLVANISCPRLTDCVVSQ